MARPISKINSAKDSASKPSGRPPPGEKSLGIDPAIGFYEIEDSYKTEE